MEKKAAKRNPYAPFTTSTLQMDASRKLGFSAKQTMQVAQRLYEGVDLGGEMVGLITYMRTDGVTIMPEAISAIRGMIAARVFAEATSPPFIREYKTKAKNAQEAHEAIRPTDPRPQAAGRLASYLERDQARLYELIWKRAVASQMASAEVEQTTADIEVKGRDGKAYTLRATGSVVQFDGFLKVYEEGRDDRVRVVEKGKDDHSDDETTAGLPAARRGRQGQRSRHRGRAALYAAAAALFRSDARQAHGGARHRPALDLCLDDGRAAWSATTSRSTRSGWSPRTRAGSSSRSWKASSRSYVEYDFTADLEEKLDLISDGKLEWKDVLARLLARLHRRGCGDQGSARRRGAGSAE